MGDGPRPPSWDPPSEEELSRALKELAVNLHVQHGLQEPELYDLMDEAIATVRPKWGPNSPSYDEMGQ
jgi:hypothetical protein